MRDGHKMTKGGLVLVVGPSGAGKDTLINGARERLAGLSRIRFVRRVVTRASSQWEDHDSLDVETFLARQRAGDFALSWQAHDLHYGIPAQIDEWLAAGDIVICNCSRAAVAQARNRFSAVSVVLVTASPEVLADRLAGRARETSIGGRLERADEQVLADYVIVNDGAADIAIDAFVEFVSEPHDV